jgi:hypothetical protein
MRIFGDLDLPGTLAAAGFERFTVLGEDYPQYGIIFREHWSLPMSARKRAGAVARK